ncbi:hypothetical protein ANCDUO_10983 [Ancylostoma duodenale]|uniref:Neuropeptide-like protein 31 family protein n=1 Tax=Ancylostoma duodenale TaxID=51022 RepID=A0A0C2GP79_9BILA|nr:hypothetical protein ANCDUO_10983 [Ancylostoma duodenale]
MEATQNLPHFSEQMLVNADERNIEDRSPSTNHECLQLLSGYDTQGPMIAMRNQTMSPLVKVVVLLLLSVAYTTAWWGYGYGYGGYGYGYGYGYGWGGM